MNLFFSQDARGRNITQCLSSYKLHYTHPTKLAQKMTSGAITVMEEGLHKLKNSYSKFRQAQGNSGQGQGHR